MALRPLILFLFVTGLKIQLVCSQYWNSYGSYDPYAYYGYGQPYALPGYGACPQFGYGFQNCYKPYQSAPNVIVIEDKDDGWEWLDFLNFISSQNQPNDPIYIPYPVPMSCDNAGNDCGRQDCGCENKRCGCCNQCEGYDTCGCDCGCRNQENKCNSGCGCSKCACKNGIKHKCRC